MDDVSPTPAPDLTPRQLKLRKFLVLLLVHRPARFASLLDDEGSIALPELLRLLHGLPNFRWVTRADVLTAIGVPRAPRFELRDERLRVVPDGPTTPADTIPPEKCGTMEAD